MERDVAVKIRGDAILALLLGRHVEPADFDGQNHLHLLGVGPSVEIGEEPDGEDLKALADEACEFFEVCFG